MLGTLDELLDVLGQRLTLSIDVHATHFDHIGRIGTREAQGNVLIEQYEGRILAGIVEILLIIREVFGKEGFLLGQVVQAHENLLVRKESKIDDTLDQRHTIRELEQCMGNIRWR